MDLPLSVNLLTAPTTDLERKAHALLLQHVTEVNDRVSIRYGYYNRDRHREVYEAWLYSDVTDQSRYSVGETPEEALEHLTFLLRGEVEGTQPCTVPTNWIAQVVSSLRETGADIAAPSGRATDAICACLENGRRAKFTAYWRLPTMGDNDTLYGDVTISPTGKFESTMVVHMETRDLLTACRIVEPIGLALSNLQSLFQGAESRVG